VEGQLDHARSNHVVQCVPLLGADHDLHAKLPGGFEKVGRAVRPRRQQ